MEPWLATLLAAGAVYVAFVLALVAAGRGAQARTWLRLVPDCLVLAKRLLGDPRVPRRSKAALVLLVAYLASPVDLVPDVVPVAGQLDDAVVAALVLRRVLRSAGADVVRDRWPGTPASLALLLRLTGAARPAPA